MLEKLMHEWLYVSDYDVSIEENDFANRALINGIDLEAKYVAVVATNDNLYLPELPLAFDLDKNKRIYVMQANQISDFLKTLPNSTFVGIGSEHFDLSGSIKEALFSLLLTNYIDKTVSYEPLSYLYDIVKSPLSYPHIEDRLLRIDDETQLTLWFYLKTQKSMADIAKELLVHPKTVSYRLHKIQLSTGLNPLNRIDAIPLLVSYLKIKTKRLHILETELQSLSDNMLPRDKTVSLT